jgi:hypothetical protein
LDEAVSPVDDSMAYAFEVLGGSKISEGDLARRFGEPFSVGQTVEG